MREIWVHSSNLGKQGLLPESMTIGPNTSKHVREERKTEREREKDREREKERERVYRLSSPLYKTA